MTISFMIVIDSSGRNLLETCLDFHLSLLRFENCLVLLDFLLDVINMTMETQEVEVFAGL